MSINVPESLIELSELDGVAFTQPSMNQTILVLHNPGTNGIDVEINRSDDKQLQLNVEPKSIITVVWIN